MDPAARAQEDLRVIRSLMERATVYRAISAPTAFVGGLLAIAASALIYFNNEVQPIFAHPARGRLFAALWIVALIVTLVANTFFIWREAKRDRRPFISSGMRLALRAIAPCLVVPAVYTWWFYLAGYQGGVELDLVLVWMASYGLALLATTLFAPRSLAVLGWSFLFSAVVVVAISNWSDEVMLDLPVLAMGATFGIYHLVYAVCIWSRGSARANNAAAVE